MREALVQFNQPNANIEDYRCSEVLMDRDGNYNYYLYLVY